MYTQLANNKNSVLSLLMYRTIGFDELTASMNHVTKTLPYFKSANAFNITPVVSLKSAEGKHRRSTLNPDVLRNDDPKAAKRAFRRKIPRKSIKTKKNTFPLGGSEDRAEEKRDLAPVCVTLPSRRVCQQYLSYGACYTCNSQHVSAWIFLCPVFAN